MAAQSRACGVGSACSGGSGPAPPVGGRARVGTAPLEHLLEETRYVGEVGLDAGPQFYPSFDAQERVFKRVLEACSEQGGKILTVHSVRSVSKVLSHIERLLPIDRGTVVLHWFTGSASEAKKALELGCYFSINSQMLASAKHRKLVASLPSDRLLTETDGPFVQSGGCLPGRLPIFPKRYRRWRCYESNRKRKRLPRSSATCVS